MKCFLEHLIATNAIECSSLYRNLYSKRGKACNCLGLGIFDHEIFIGTISFGRSVGSENSGCGLNVVNSLLCLLQEEWRSVTGLKKKTLLWCPVQSSNTNLHFPQRKCPLVEDNCCAASRAKFKGWKQFMGYRGRAVKSTEFKFC